jgi:hypothetical protein
METGVSHNKQWLHNVGYFRELLATNAETQPGDHRTVSENRLRSGELTQPGPATGGEGPMTQNSAGSRVHHCADLGL